MEFDSSQEDEIRWIASDETGTVDGEDISPASVSTDAATIGTGRTFVDPAVDPATAISNASAGDTLVFSPNKVYDVGATITGVKDDMTIVGLNARLADGAETTILKINADGVTLSQCTFDGNYANNTVTLAVGYSALLFTDCSEVTIRDCLIFDSIRHGVSIDDTEGVVSNIYILNNEIVDPSQDAVSPHSQTGTVGNIDGVYAIGNVCKGSHDRGCMEVNEGSRNIVYANNIYRDSASQIVEYGVDLQDHGEGTIENVLITGNTFDGIAVGVNGNKMQNVDGAINVSITDNTFYDIGKKAVRMFPNTTNALRYVTISDNIIDTVVENPIFVQFCDHFQATGNTIRNVTGTGNGEDGIRFSNCNRVTISHNTVIGVPEACISVESNDANTYSDIIIASNQTHDANAGINILNPSGNITYYLAHGNVCRNNATVNLNDSVGDATGVVTDNIAP